MRAIRRGAIVLVVGSLVAAVPALFSTTAHASTLNDRTHTRHTPHVVRVSASTGARHTLSKSGKARYAHSGGGGGISCVPFARAATGIALKGNAANWWDAAAGVYERGSRPEPGSILNFRATGHMRLGHVAVVTNVLSDREVEIDHANWAGPGASKGGVSRGIRVQDVSAANDWSAVRVALGHSDEFGSVYPTYGFIYDRPDSGRMIANVHAIRPVSDRAVLDEVAEAPMPNVIRPSISLPVDAPDHSLR